MEFKKSKAISLKNHPLYNERWLQDRIAEDPSLLGLGDVELKDRERRQPRAGRLDLLLTDPESLTRYEVELQLGATDETHIIRTIEYWDIEKSRYPQYEHVAVIVAEDITSRFLNVISLFNKSIPLIAVQLRALDVDGVLTLNATTVLDLMRQGTDEDDEPGVTTDRNYWVNRGSVITVALADDLLALVNQVGPGFSLKYNKFYIGLANANGLPDNFAIFHPRKEFVIASFRIPRSDEVTALIDEAGLDALPYSNRAGRYRIRLTPSDVTKHRGVVLELIKRANGSPSPEFED
jgi:hypothetical protein